MLQAMRRGIGSWAAKLILGLLILAFAAFFGFGDFAGIRRDVTVAKVGGHDITASQFQRELRQVQARMPANLDPQRLLELGLGDFTLRQMIDRSLFNQAVSRLGLTVPDAVIREQILANPAFRNELGQFDRFAFEAVLRNAGLNEQGYVAASRQDAARDQLVSSVTGGGTVPDVLAEGIYKYRMEGRVAEVMIIPHASIDVGAPDEAAISQFRNDHPERFTAPEYRGLTYITLTPEDLLPETQVSEDELKEEYEARLDAYVTPERRVVEQMILGQQSAALEAHARLERGQNFAAVAVEASGLSADDIALGSVVREELPAGTADAVFALPVGGYSEPLQSPFGWHVFRVVESVPGGVRGLDEVREELLREMKLERAADLLFELANKVEDELAGGASLADTAQRLDLQLRTIEAIDVTGRDKAGKPVAELLAAGEFLRAAFEAAAGTETPITETDQGGYFILRVDRIIPPTLRPLDAVREQVIAAWTASELAGAARRKAEEVSEKVQIGADMASLGKELRLEVRTTAALNRDAVDADPALSALTLATLFRLGPGQVSIGETPAGDAHVVARLKEIRPANPSADRDAVGRLGEDLRATMADDLMTQYRAALRADYEVSVNQRVFDELLEPGSGGGGF